MKSQHEEFEIIKCPTCHFIASKQSLSIAHKKIEHMEIKVTLEAARGKDISCEQCKFKCMWNIQLKKQVEKHQKVCDFQCNFCAFKSNALL